MIARPSVDMSGRLNAFPIQPAMRRVDAGCGCGSSPAGRYMRGPDPIARSSLDRHKQFYIGGRWVEPAEPAALDVIDPSTEQPFTAISLGSKADIGRAVGAAKAAFTNFSQTLREDRLGLLRRISSS